MQRIAARGIYVNMVDANSNPSSNPGPGPNPLFLRDEELREGIELLFFAYRDFTAEADAMLARYGLGRTHHRALYFVGRHPGIAVKELLAILKITKQSLAPVLRRLVGRGLVERRRDGRDGRRRALHLSAAGHALEARLTAAQRARIARAYRAAGADAVTGYRQVLAGMADRGSQPAGRAP